jgi:NNP family nitrate/nitrite transporter-like MFS transporter
MPRIEGGGGTAALEATPPGAFSVLTISTIAFTAFFAVWVMFAIVGIPLRTQLNLSDSQFALLVAIPVLTGAALRIPAGMLADIFGGRRMMAGIAFATSIPAFAISTADGYGTLVALAFCLGLAGSSFAAGVPWVSNWFPAHRQGMALGIFGMGNVGASIIMLAAPALVTLVPATGLAGGLVPGGWRFVPFAYGGLMILIGIMLLTLSPRDNRAASRGRSMRSMLEPLGRVRVWRFGYYYMIVFGGYVALTLWLPKYYVDVYDTSLATAGVLTATFIFPASLLRPLGGILSDRFGARSVTATALTMILTASIVLTLDTNIVVFAIGIAVIGVAMGIGTGSVFAYIPLYFPGNVGTVGGLVGALGGIGGFTLPFLFAGAGALTGVPQSTFVLFALLAAASLGMLAIAVVNLVADEHGQRSL